MGWARTVSPGFNKFQLEQLDKELKTKRVFKSKLKILLQHLSIANNSKRMFRKGLNRCAYPDNLEYSILIDRRKSLAKNIVEKYKLIKGRVWTNIY